MDDFTAEDFIQKRRAKIQQGLTIEMKDISRTTTRAFTIEASTFLICKHRDAAGAPFKIFVFERIRASQPAGAVAYNTWEDGEKTTHPNIEYRFGYYIIGKIGNKAGRWTWGQYCPMIAHSDFKQLIDQATQEGTILP